MSMRQTQCPECRGTDHKVTKEYEPETNQINMKVQLVCRDCGITWDDRVISHYTEKLRRAGIIRI